jgi:hypothetical protein
MMMFRAHKLSHNITLLMLFCSSIQAVTVDLAKRKGDDQEKIVPGGVSNTPPDKKSKEEDSEAEAKANKDKKDKTEEGDKDNTIWYIGGGIFFAIIIGLLIFCCMCRRRN